MVDKVRIMESQGRLIGTARKWICWIFVHPVRVYRSGWDSAVGTREWVAGVRERKEEKEGQRSDELLGSGTVERTRIGQIDI